MSFITVICFRKLPHFDGSDTDDSSSSINNGTMINGDFYCYLTCALLKPVHFKMFSTLPFDSYDFSGCEMIFIEAWHMIQLLSDAVS